VADLLTSTLQDESVSARSREALNTAIEAHNDSLAAIGQLKGLVSRVRQGRRPVAPQKRGQCDVGRVVDATVRIVRAEIEKAARLGVVLESSPMAAIEASVMGQVVLNLLLNAAQAVRAETKAENLISVRVAERDGLVRVTVSDNGPGIPPENLERIFDPFFTTKDTGTGLGLAICRELVSQANGNIAVESLPGQGATFVMSLPLAKGDQ
jgi:signal transduction histidine kinase